MKSSIPIANFSSKAKKTHSTQQQQPIVEVLLQNQPKYQIRKQQLKEKQVIIIHKWLYGPYSQYQQSSDQSWEKWVLASTYKMIQLRCKQIYQQCHCIRVLRYQSPSMKPTLTCRNGFRPRSSIGRAHLSDAATSDKDKQICFLLVPRT